MKIVINEWLPEYFRPNESIENRDKAIRFLEKLIDHQDNFVVKKGSPFEKKINKYSKECSYDLTARQLYKGLIKLMMNPTFSTIVRAEEIAELPARILNKLNLPNTNYSSDTYLFEAASTTEEKIIITTDIKLVTLFQDEKEYNVVDLDDFIKNY